MDYFFPGEPILSAEYNELASYYSDFHKDVNGYRPRWIIGCADGFTSVEELRAGLVQIRAAVDQLHADIERSKSTFEGREALREDGWLIEETDPAYLEAAAASKAERDARRAREEYECSYEYYEEQQKLTEAQKAEQAADDLESFLYDKYEVAV